MPLILRVDVDKPYGNKNLFKRILSKISEDYFIFKIKRLGYLNDLEKFLLFCNQNNISGYFYFRLCTLPNKRVLDQLMEGNHKIGLHLEDSTSYESFLSEISKLRREIPLKITTFTKHGSGSYKLGKNHFPLYEPLIYLEWSKKQDCSFIFGNGITKGQFENKHEDNFYPEMFWVEREYRNEDFFTNEVLLMAAESNTIPVLIHPCNFISNSQANIDFKNIVSQSKIKKIQWATF
jgi:hypothetical protein